MKIAMFNNNSSKQEVRTGTDDIDTVREGIQIEAVTVLPGTRIERAVGNMRAAYNDMFPPKAREGAYRVTIQRDKRPEFLEQYSKFDIMSFRDMGIPEVRLWAAGGPMNNVRASCNNRSWKERTPQVSHRFSLEDAANKLGEMGVAEDIVSKIIDNGENKQDREWVLREDTQRSRCWPF